MVRVYVESNFLLELALEQSGAGACGELLALAGSGKIEMAVPAFALVEPRWTIRKQSLERTQALEGIGSLFKKVRTNLHLGPEEERLRGDLQALIDLSDKEEMPRLHGISEHILGVASVLPLTAALLRDASRLVVELDLDFFDAVILASVLADRGPSSPKSYFVNKNVKDFGEPRVVRALSERGCEFVGNFDGGLARVRRALTA